MHFLVESSIVCLAAPLNRRTFVAQTFLATTATCTAASAAETIGKEQDCNDATCLGVWDGLLADCPHGIGTGGGAGCVSSQDDTPGTFAEPWDYSEASYDADWQQQMKLLVPALQLVCGKRGDGVTIDLQSGRYLRASISDGKSGERSSAEFFFTENDTTVQFRINSIDAFSVRAVMSAKRNMDRAEEVRKYLRYTKLPVLRNRQRRFFFGESELDGFGPGSASLGPPAEMSSGELEGRNSDLIDPKMKIDLMQSFPRVDKSGPF